MFRACGIRSYKRQVQICLHSAGKFYFCFFSRFSYTLHRHTVILQIYAGFFFKLACDMVYKHVIHVCAAELRIAARSLYLKTAGLVLFVIPHIHDGNVQGSAAKVKNHYLQIIFRFIYAVSEARGSRLVYYSQNLQARDLSGVLCGLALVVVEISRARNDNAFNLIS